MMLSILSRLPVKSLVRFNSVYKPIEFIRIHCRQFSQASVQSHLLKGPILGKKMLAVTHLANPHETFLDSCKGLVCLGRPFFTRQIVLWNPATSFWKTLPPSTTNFGPAEMVSLGFGCNAEGDDYTVVRIFCLDTRLGVEVYSSKSDSWRKIEVGFKATVFNPKNHVIANGNPYWTAEVDDASKSEEDRMVLLGFDSTKLTFEFVPLPKIEGRFTFVNWGECLAGLVTGKRDGGWLESIDIWVYDAGERMWRRNARFGPVELQVETCLDCSSSGKIAGVCVGGKVFVYDSKEGSVVVTDLQKRIGHSFQMFPYDESLGYVQGMKPMVVKEEDFLDIEGLFVFSLPHFTEELAFC